LKAIRGPLFGLFLVAVDTGDSGAAAALSGRMHENLALVLTSPASSRRTRTTITNILLSPDFQRLRGELMLVLARYRDAQAEVASVFRQAGLRPAAEMSAGSKYDGSTSAEAEHAA
jgi:hypothetical protein